VAYFAIVLSAGLGPVIVGTAVARTIGAGIADFHATGPLTLVAAIAGAVVAVGISYGAGVPTSLSVALFSSMVGALWVGPGLGAVHWAGIAKVGISMALSIVVGSFSGMVAYVLVVSLLVRLKRRAAQRVLSLQYVTVALLALGYGSNDLEKTAGLLAAGIPSATFSVPLWTVAVAIIFFAAGMAIGGVRVAKTVGGKLFVIRPLHALAFQLASASTVIGAASLGGPLSTTETSASAIVGVGAAQNPRALRWPVVRHIWLSWIATAPLALAAGALAGFVVKLF